MDEQTLKIINPIVIGGEAALGVFFGILIFLAIGRQIGQRVVARDGAAGLASGGSLETAVFAILGLLIAFTFSGALTRFDVRRAQIVDEANAIGTAYLRIDVLPSGAQPRLRQAFRDYVDARIATYKKLPDVEAARNELVRSQGLQADIWAQAVIASRTPDSRPGTEGLVLPALNEMFDITTVRAMASQMHPPRHRVCDADRAGPRFGTACRLSVSRCEGLSLGASVGICRHRRVHGLRDPGHRVPASRLDSPGCHGPSAGQRACEHEIGVAGSQVACPLRGRADPRNRSRRRVT